MSFTANFWPILATAGGDKDTFRGEFEKLSKPAMVRFYMDWQTALAPLRVPPFQRDHLSDDAVDDMAQFIVQSGQAFYDDILAHPEKHRALDENAYSAFGSVMSRVFHDRFGEEIGPIAARLLTP